MASSEPLRPETVLPISLTLQQNQTGYSSYQIKPTTLEQQQQQKTSV